MQKQRAIICDIDMTLLDSSMVDAACKGLVPPERWDCFYAHLHECKMIEWCYELLKRINLPVVFITGRCVTYKDKTVPFLDMLDIPYILLMRDDGDTRPDDEVKKDLLDSVIDKYDFLFCLDDREQNCKLFASYNIPTLMVYYL